MQKQEETIEIILQKLQEKQENCIKLQDEINSLQEEKEIKKEKLQEIQTLIMRGKNVKEKKELLIKTLDLAQENKTLKKDYQHEAAINQLSQKMDFLLKTNELKFINFETLYNEFLEKKKADDDVGIESYQSYQSTFNFTKNFFENKNLNELNYKNQDDLKIYLQNTESESKGKLLSKVTLNNHIQTLSSFFHFGEDRELLDKNFLKNIKQFKEEKVEKDNYSDEQLLKILSSDMYKFNAYNKQRKPIHNYYNLFKIAIYSGCRISEILKLQKENVKQDRFTIVDAKTENGNRTVPIHPLLKKKDFTDLIDNLKVKYTNEKEEKEIINYHTKNANKILKKLDISLLEKQTFHTLRSTFIQKLVNKDISKKVLVQMMVGHSIPDEDKLTLKIYAKKINFEIYKELMEQFELK